MSLDQQLGQILWEAYDDGCRRLEAELWRFFGPLNEWVSELLKHRLPVDWRGRLGAYLDTWEPEGFEVAADQRQILEDWIEDWARYRGLLPEMERPVSAPSESTATDQSLVIAFPPTVNASVAGGEFDVEAGSQAGRNELSDPSQGRRTSEGRIASDADASNPAHNVGDVPPSARNPWRRRVAALPFAYVPDAIRNYGGTVIRVIGNDNGAFRDTSSLNADFSFDWKANGARFLDDAESELSTLVGIVQIARAAVKFDRQPWSAYHSWANSYGWRVDRRIPYPYQSGHNTIAHPAFSNEIASFTDFPGGFRADGWRGRIVSISSDFELNFMCLEGAEPKTTYGGIEWGVSYNLVNETAWAQSDWRTAYAFSQYERTIGLASSRFISIVSRYMDPP